MAYYPEQTFIMGLTTIRRERSLPRGAISEVMVREGDRVDAPDVVLRGAIPGNYMIFDVLELLGLRNLEQLTPDMINVHAGQVVEAGELLAERGRRKILAPQTAVVARIDGDQIILQLHPEPIEIRALCPGDVTSVRGTNAVLIESIGALIQGAWGNGKQAFTSYRQEPDEGIESLPADGLLPQYRGVAMIVPHTVRSEEVFIIAAAQEMTGLVIPSMHADLIDAAMAQEYPIIVTEGFGEQKMSDMVYNLLLSNMGRQATLDAKEPGHWSSERPEIIIPLPSGNTPPPAPETNQPIVEGAQVRVTRAPLIGMAGRVKRVIEEPRPVESGLTLPGADVAFPGGRVVFVPLANLEMLGQHLDAQSDAE